MLGKYSTKPGPLGVPSISVATERIIRQQDPYDRKNHPKLVPASRNKSIPRMGVRL